MECSQLIENRQVALPSTKIAIQFHEHLAELLHEEARFLSMTVSGLLRRLLRWNAGGAPGRPPGSPARSFPKTVEAGAPRVKLQMRIAVGDFDHMKQLTARGSMPSSSVLAALLLRWLGLDAFARGEQRY